MLQIRVIDSNCSFDTNSIHGLRAEGNVVAGGYKSKPHKTRNLSHTFSSPLLQAFVRFNLLERNPGMGLTGLKEIRVHFKYLN
jgi:hypothetical protein